MCPKQERVGAATRACVELPLCVPFQLKRLNHAIYFPDALEIFQTLYRALEEVWKMVQKNGRVALRKQVRRPAKASAEPVDTHAHMSMLITSLQQQLRSAMTLNQCAYAFKLDNPEDVDNLIDLLWSGDIRRGLHTLVSENPALTALLFAITGNTYVPAPARREMYEFHRSNLLAGVFSQLYRMRSQKCTTLITVLLALKAYKTKADGAFLDALGCFFKGAIMSDEWTEKFVQRALLRRPSCPFTPVPDFGLTAFDNLQIRIGYKAFATQDTAGVTTNYMLDMTNWLTFDIPAHVAPQLPDGRIREISAQRAHEPHLHGATSMYISRTPNIARLIRHSASAMRAFRLRARPTIVVHVSTCGPPACVHLTPRQRNPA